MTNPTQPTPEQLARWHEDADTAYARDLDVHISSPSREAYTAGYIYGKQENEQALKLAKFGAMVAISYVNGDRFVPVHELDNLARIYSVVDSASVFTSDIKATIKELLND